MAYIYSNKTIKDKNIYIRCIKKYETPYMHLKKEMWAEPSLNLNFVFKTNLFC